MWLRLDLKISSKITKNIQPKPNFFYCDYELQRVIHNEQKWWKGQKGTFGPMVPNSTMMSPQAIVHWPLWNKMWGNRKDWHNDTSMKSKAGACEFFYKEVTPESDDHLY